MRASTLLTFALGGRVAAEPISDLCTKHTGVQVEAMVYSGTDNPVFRVEDDEWKLICKKLEVTKRNTTIPSCRVLGFTGWKICGDSGKDCATTRGNQDIDLPLFTALSKQVPELTVETQNHITDELARLHQSDFGDVQCADLDSNPIPPSNSACTGPILGSDDPTTVHYDPQHDDQGCFVTEQSKNNCYDYGNDIVTNTFAQPGRGSGVCPPNTRPCVKNTCDDVKNAAISDGLTWVGSELPTSLPKEGHYVSLHIWPNSNFHWIRMDADKTWSHKPGGSPVRNVDNNHQKITDPSKSDFSPWTQHCGYMLAVPSKGKITTEKASVMV